MSVFSKYICDWTVVHIVLVRQQLNLSERQQRFSFLIISVPQKKPQNQTQKPKPPETNKQK